MGLLEICTMQDIVASFTKLANVVCTLLAIYSVCTPSITLMAEVV